MAHPTIRCVYVHVHQGDDETAEEVERFVCADTDAKRAREMFGTVDERNIRVVEIDVPADQVYAFLEGCVRLGCKTVCSTLAELETWLNWNTEWHPRDETPPGTFSSRIKAIDEADPLPTTTLTRVVRLEDPRQTEANTSESYTEWLAVGIDKAYIREHWCVEQEEGDYNHSFDFEDVVVPVSQLETVFATAIRLDYVNVYTSREQCDAHRAWWLHHVFLDLESAREDLNDPAWDPNADPEPPTYQLGDAVPIPDSEPEAKRAKRTDDADASA